MISPNFARLAATMPIILLGISACAPPPPPPEPEVATFAETCNAESYAYLKGEPIDVVNTLSTTLRTRVLAADSFVPRDFDPNRLTFTTSPDGEVSRIFCG